MASIDDFIQQEGTVFPGKTYADHVLRHVFNVQRDYLFRAMFKIHQAHVTMLAEEQIITPKEACTILQAVEKLRVLEPANLHYDPAYEDLFFMMEDQISKLIGPDLAGNMHIGRSRNDMGVAMYRLVLREHILAAITNANQLGEALLTQASEHRETIMTAYTHTQPAQPTTLGHYLLAVYDTLVRDIHRLWAAYQTVNRSPLGAAALATTGFPINRKRTMELLGFDSLVENSYDAIAGADYLIESATAIVSLMVNIGRWIQDFLQLSTKEFGIFTAADPYVQISSIMPQKRNPVSLEHSRALASSAAGEALTAVQMIHNTPFGDIVDTEDDLQPQVYRSYEKANRVLCIMSAVILTMKVDKEKAASRAKTNCITITELADTLTREKQVPFRLAHRIASHIAKKCEAEKKELHELDISSVNEWMAMFYQVTLTEEEWLRVICPNEFINKRKVQGGPNFDEVKRMAEERKKEIQNLKEKCKHAKEKLLQAEKKLDCAIQKLK